MRERWIHLVLLAGLVSPALAQERPRTAAPAPERTRERTLMVSPDVDRFYYFSTNRGKMGITVSIRPEASDSIGALVDAVSPGSPAFKAGVQSGDIITRFNGRSVLTMARETRKPSPGLALIEVATSLGAGDTAHLEYRRGPNRKTATIVLVPFSEYSALPPSTPERTPRQGEPMIIRDWEGRQPMPTDVFMGPDEEPGFFLRFKTMSDLELAPMNPGLGQYFGVNAGVLVIRAPEGTTLNLQSGDVVTRIDGRRVSTPSQLFRVLRSYESGEQFRIEIMRMKRRATVTASIAGR